MKEQGYRTTTEAAQGAVGVLSGDAAGAPAGFQMRASASGGERPLQRHLDRTAKHHVALDGYGALQQVEFLKGPSALMSGLNAIGGSVNYVSRQPTPGGFKTSSTCRSIRWVPSVRITARPEPWRRTSTIASTPSERGSTATLMMSIGT